MTIQSNVLSWKNQSRPPPMVRPAATCSQNPYGLEGPSSTAIPARTNARPTTIVTVADQLPPPETRSVTKNHNDAASRATRRGKRKILSATAEATIAATSRAISQNRKPLNAESVSGNQPAQSSSAPSRKMNETTELSASRPAVTSRAARFAAEARAVTATKTMSAHRATPAEP